MASTEDFVIDFSKEEKGGSRFHIKDGTYPVKILGAKPITSSEKGTPGLELTCVITDGKYRKKKFTETLWATPKAYSRFRTLLEACGKKVPQKVNLTKIAKVIKGEVLYMEIAEEPPREGYQPRSRVTFDGFISEEDYDPDEDSDEEDLDDEDDDLDDADDEDDDEDDDEEEPAPKKKSKKSKAKKKKADDDEDDDIEDLDLDEF